MKLKKFTDFFYSESGDIGLDFTKTEIGHVDYERSDWSTLSIVTRRGSSIRPNAINAKTRYVYHPWNRK